MEDGLKQRIYENILRFLENYRYIKSTAEATIPNFIAFCISRHWILTYRQSISHIVHLFKAASSWRAYIRCMHEWVTVKSPFQLPYSSQKGLKSYYNIYRSWTTIFLNNCRSKTEFCAARRLSNAANCWLDVYFSAILRRNLSITARRST